MKRKIKKYDKDYIWHPFTKLSDSYDPLIISSAKDEKLIDIDGNKYIDLISSWWVNTHGHCREEISSAIKKQIDSFEQVLFTDFTHEPAVNLAKNWYQFYLIILRKFFILTMVRLRSRLQ